MPVIDSARKATASDAPPLPRRRRQASLAPQLRDSSFVPEEADDVGTVRSPEQIRDIMSAFQHNSYRARHAEGTEER
jgi:hypothetical protein